MSSKNRGKVYVELPWAIVALLTKAPRETAELADLLDVHEHSVRRHLALAEAEGVASREQRTRPDGRRLPDLWRWTGGAS